MNTLLERLGQDVLPKVILDEFVSWCIWEQARPALAILLEHTGLPHIAVELEVTHDSEMLAALAEEARERSAQFGSTDRVLERSATEAAAFEFLNLLNVSREADFDPEAAAFFSARVCGWSGWAQQNFGDPARKTQSEDAARQAQEACLQALIARHNA